MAFLNIIIFLRKSLLIIRYFIDSVKLFHYFFLFIGMNKKILIMAIFSFFSFSVFLLLIILKILKIIQILFLAKKSIRLIERRLFFWRLTMWSKLAFHTNIFCCLLSGYFLSIFLDELQRRVRIRPYRLL